MSCAKRAARPCAVGGVLTLDLPDFGVFARAGTVTVLPD
jgi:hypothetical protein